MSDPITAETIQSTLERIRTSVSRGGENGLRLAVTVDGVPARLAINAHSLPELVLPHRLEQKKPATEDREGVGISIAERIIEDRRYSCLIVTCRQSEAEPPFVALVADILRRLSRGESRNSAIEGAIQAFTTLVESPRRQLNEEELVGLLGELYVLREISATVPAAVEAWHGPQGGTHDFAFPRLALEIKTTRKKDRLALDISRPEQLFPPPGRALFLAMLQLEADPAGELHFGSLCSQIIGRLPSAAAFRDALMRLGLTPELPPGPADSRYRLIALKLWDVREDFPKIEKELLLKLPKGISGLRFQLDTGHLEPWELPSGLAAVPGAA